MFLSAYARGALPLIVLLAGCATQPGTAPPKPAPRPSAAVPAPATAAAPVPPAPTAAPEPAGQKLQTLGTERDWLLSFFTGTPVVIEQRSDGLLGVEVPREFCFDAQRSAVKPPLAAVLDKVAESLRRTRARLPVVAAPGDSSASSPLALQRAAQVRKHLLSRGVPAEQLGAPTASTVAAVQLRMDPALR